MTVRETDSGLNSQPTLPLPSQTGGNRLQPPLISQVLSLSSSLPTRLPLKLSTNSLQLSLHLKELSIMLPPILCLSQFRSLGNLEEPDTLTERKPLLPTTNNLRTLEKMLLKTQPKHQLRPMRPQLPLKMTPGDTNEV